MSTLILDRSNLHIRHESGALVVEGGAGGRSSVPVRMLERVVVHSLSVQITSGAVLNLISAGAGLVIINARQARDVAIVCGGAHNDAAVRIAQAQAVSNSDGRIPWATSIVTRKMRRQLRLLARLRELRPDRRKPLSDAMRTVRNLLNTIDETKPTIDQLRGFEGAAAAAYFRGFTRVFSQSWRFTARNRRPPRDPVNACLSLAYTLLHFDAVRAAHAAGLDPALGFYHRTLFARESLACDIIEPLRPVVDHEVWRLVADRTLRLEHFSDDKGACLLRKSGRGHFYAAWEAFAPMHRRYLRRECAVLARHLRDTGQILIEALSGPEDDEVELA